ncbi:Hypothetical protein, putative [Bodo saltans]|uniref:Uncharacterized protein n=1 Tax=Bodo saltans TaxID=75058 RepID=A0A0S4J9M0_BODSA|nr:Hypothetical protein, putative [Bodo saltans]|eukprot:CUG86626.1 Hypothetical protein, putative [Bodo saltans]
MFDGAAFDSFDIEEDFFMEPVQASRSGGGGLHDFQTSHGPPSVVWKRFQEPHTRRRSSSHFLEMGDVDVGDISVGDDWANLYHLEGSSSAMLPMEMSIDPEHVHFDNFFSDEFGDEEALGGSAIVHVRSPQPDDDVLSDILKANLYPAPSMYNRKNSKGVSSLTQGPVPRLLPTEFDDEFDLDSEASGDHQPLLDDTSSFVLATMTTQRILSTQRPSTIVRPHAVSPDELSNMSDDDLDAILARNLPQFAASPRLAASDIDVSMRPTITTTLHNNGGSGTATIGAGGGGLGNLSSFDLPLTAVELQNLIDGTMDVHALFGDDDDLLLSPPTAALLQPHAVVVGGEEDVQKWTPVSMAMTTLSLTEPNNNNAAALPPRNNSVLNALPLGIVRRSSPQLRRRQQTSLSSADGARLKPSKDAVERRLTKALCALQATYLLTPRLFGSVIADVSRQTEDSLTEEDTATQPQSALSRRLERHLTGIMELEAHAMKLLVLWNQLGDEEVGSNATSSAVPQERR